MGRPKGIAKSGGRKAGIPNKVTQSTRSWLNNLLENNRAQIEKDLKELEPKDRLNFLEKLLSYSLPKLASVTAEINLNDLTDDDLSVIIEQITKDID